MVVVLVFLNPFSRISSALQVMIGGKHQQSLIDLNFGRIIAHIDLDCFYVGVERFVNPSLRNKPVAVVQYNPFGDLKTRGPYENRQVDNNGSIIAVSYEARARGVKRNMRGYEAKSNCNDIILVQVPTNHGKADLTIYRKISKEIVDIIQSSNQSILGGIIVEKASIDEVYLDLTENVGKLHTIVENNMPTYSSFDKSMDTPITPAILLSEASKGRFRFQDYVDYFIRQLKTNENGTLTEQSAQSGTVQSSNPVVAPSTSGGELQTLICQLKLAGDDLSELSMSRYDLSKGHESTITSSDNYFSYSWLTRPIHQWSYNDKLLIYGSVIVQYLREQIYQKLYLTCSSGISNNKMLAKIASAMHKPNKVTLFPHSFVSTILKQLPITRVPGYNGKAGQEIQDRFPELKFIGEFVSKSKDELLSVLCQGLKKGSNEMNAAEATVERLYQACRGVDNDPVILRSLPKSIGCGKTFRYQNALLLKDILSNSSTVKDREQTPNDNSNKLLYWLRELSSELYERCEIDSIDNNRIAKQATIGISVTIPKPGPVQSSEDNSWDLRYSHDSFHFTKATSLPKTIDQMASKGYDLIRGILQSSSFQSSLRSKGYDLKALLSMQITKPLHPPHISSLSLAAGDFVTIASQKNSIVSYFQVSSEAVQVDDVKDTHNDSTRDWIGNDYQPQSINNEKTIICEHQSNIDVNKDHIESSRSASYELHDNLKDTDPGESDYDYSHTLTETVGEFESNGSIDSVKNHSPQLHRGRDMNDRVRITNEKDFVPSSIDDIDNEVLAAMPSEIRSEIIRSLKRPYSQQNQDKISASQDVSPSNKRRPYHNRNISVRKPNQSMDIRAMLMRK